MIQETARGLRPLEKKKHQIFILQKIKMFHPPPKKNKPKSKYSMF